MDRVWSGVRDAFAVITDGVRLVGRHLPVLLTLYLFGAAVHGAVIWLAVNVSNDWPLVAQLILPLAPMASLAAIIFMLRSISQSLHWADFGAAPGTSPGQQVSRGLGLLASLLIPFLTVYSAQGFLKADREKFVNMTAASEFIEGADAFYADMGPDRFFVTKGVVVIGVIAIAFVIRRLINHFDLAEKSKGVGILAGYIEVFWLVTVAGAITSYVNSFNEWRDSRAFTVWVMDVWNQLVELLGPIGTPLKAAVEWLLGLLTNGTDLVVVPLAWLTVGAVAYGKRSALEADQADQADHVDLPGLLKPGAVGRWVPGLQAVRSGTERVPEPIRRVGRNATADLRDRFTSFAQGVKLLAIAGFVPMLLFCVVFAVAKVVERGVGELLRLLRGPVSATTGIALEPWLDVLRSAAYTVLIVGLIAAAIDRIVRRREVEPQLGDVATGPVAPHAGTPRAEAPPAEAPQPVASSWRYEWPT